MECSAVRFTRHAFERLFERAISPDAVLRIIEEGEVIASYPDDLPFPGVLILGFEGATPIHHGRGKRPPERHMLRGDGLCTGACSVERRFQNPEANMKCMICKTGETRAGTATVTLQRAETTVLVKGTPADVCQNCGEYYLDEAVARKLYAQADEAARRHAEVEIIRYAA